MYDQYENSDPQLERKQKVTYGDSGGNRIAPSASGMPTMAQGPQGSAPADPNGLFKALSQRIPPMPGQVVKEASQPGGGFLPPDAMGQRIDNGAMNMPMIGGVDTMQPTAPSTWGLPGGMGGGIGRGVMGSIPSMGFNRQSESPLMAQLSQLFRKNAY